MWKKIVTMPADFYSGSDWELRSWQDGCLLDAAWGGGQGGHRSDLQVCRASCQGVARSRARNIYSRNTRYYCTDESPLYYFLIYTSKAGRFLDAFSWIQEPQKLKNFLLNSGLHFGGKVKLLLNFSWFLLLIVWKTPRFSHKNSEFLLKNSAHRRPSAYHNLPDGAKKNHESVRNFTSVLSKIFWTP